MLKFGLYQLLASLSVHEALLSLGMFHFQEKGRCDDPDIRRRYASSQVVGVGMICVGRPPCAYATFAHH